LIDRSVFLEYTRKMSLKKHCLQRVHVTQLKSRKTWRSSNFAFGAVEPKVQNKEVGIAKAVPFAKELKEKKFLKKDAEYHRLLEALLLSELKSEPLANVAAEVAAGKCKGAKSVRFYYGVYEVPQKRVFEQGSSALVTENESGELYPHLICVIEDAKGKMLHGFMYPAYREERYGDKERYDFV